jgi:uncharacterized membrane protein YtjA (UPF0391 family)
MTVYSWCGSKYQQQCCPIWAMSNVDRDQRATAPVRAMLAEPSGERAMLRWAAIFLIISLIAGILGFWGIAGAAAEIAKVLFFIFLMIFLITLLFGWRGRAPPV